MQNRANATDDNEIHLVFREGPKNGRKIKGEGWHHAVSPQPEGVAEELPTVRPVSATTSSESA
jgi:hypothetical protein